MMNTLFKENNPSLKINFATIILIGILLFSSSVFSQKNDVKIKQIDSINLKLKDPEIKIDTSGILKKIMQFFKFKENRNLKEQERIYSYLDSLVVKGDLKVDTVEFNNIVSQILKEFKNDSLLLEKNKFHTDSLDKVSKREVDSLGLILKVLLVELNNKYLNEAKKISDTIAVSLKDLREVSYSYNNIERAPEDTIVKKGVELYFEKYLKPKQNKEIIGWHNPWTGSAYKNYNYNYLTAINLYGFKLSPTGSCNNVSVIKEYFKSGGVVDYAKANNCPVYLTIFSKKSSDISAFLKNPDAHEELFEKLYTMIVVDERVNGINIFFENISENDQDLFVKFMKKLSNELKEMQDEISEEEYEVEAIPNRENKIRLYLTIPSIYNDESLKSTSAYKFEALNEIVHYYIVMTERMTSFKSKWAQSSSPLYDNDDLTHGSIESTINFYSNGKIPISKLIMTVSYLGIEWSVYDTWGEVKYKDSTSSIKYRDIIRKYKRNRNLEIRNHYTEAFDSIQVAAYLSIIRSDWNTTQIWYEDIRSLKQKYKWALDNNLGGVSIRGLGYDDGYPELWNVMGTTLLEIDSAFHSPKSEPIKLCHFDSIKKNDSINSRSLNTKIFGKGRWEKKDTVSGIWENFQEYNYSAQIDKESKSILDKYVKSVKKYLEEYWLYSDYKWATEPETYYITDFGKNLIPNENGEYLNDEEICRCLYERQIIFSKISFYLAAICILIIAFLIFRINHLDRFNKGGKLERFIIKMATLFLGILGATLIFYGLYMTPYFNEFGASNQGEVSLRVFVVLIFLGVLLGLYISYRHSKGKYLSKNLP